MNVLIVEDEIVIARYFEQIVKMNFPALEVQIAVTIPEAEEKLRKGKPQLVLCDINLNDSVSGIELIEKYRLTYAFELVFVTSYYNREMVQRAIPAAPAHYLIKPVEEGQLIAVIEIVLNKFEYEREEKETGISRLRDQLTRSEFQMLQLIAAGLSTVEISKKLFISPYTVKNHRHNICRKLDITVKGNSSILKWLTENNLMFLGRNDIL